MRRFNFRCEPFGLHEPVGAAGDLAPPPAFWGHGEHLPHLPCFLSVDHELQGERICVIAAGNRAADALALALECRADLGCLVADEFTLDLSEDAQDVDDEAVLRPRSTAPGR